MKGWYIIPDSGLPIWLTRSPWPGAKPVSDDPAAPPKGSVPKPGPRPAWELEALKAKGGK